MPYKRECSQYWFFSSHNSLEFLPVTIIPKSVHAATQRIFMARLTGANVPFYFTFTGKSGFYYKGAAFAVGWESSTV